MADYNRDEILRQERKLKDAKRSQQIVDSMRNSKEWPQSVKIGEEKCETFKIDISDDLFLRVAKEAHARDVTFNDMVHTIIKDGLKDAEYRFEHDTKPSIQQFLTEYK